MPVFADIEMEATKEKRKQCNEENLIKAVNAVKRGMSRNNAAKKFQVPRSTVFFRLQNLGKIILRPGPPTILTPEEETSLG